jgi:hypothetical protein
MDLWTRGEAPTLEEFARAWTRAKAEEHRLLTVDQTSVSWNRIAGWLCRVEVLREAA